MQTIKKQLLPIITQNNIQKALNITTEEADKKKIIHNTDILTDNEYYTNETIYKKLQQKTLLTHHTPQKNKQHNKKTN